MNEYTIEEIQVGMSASFKKLITKEMEDSFRVITGDENPLHKEDDFALEISGGNFKGHAAFGMLTASFYSTVAGMYLPGKYSLIHSFDEISFMKPVFVGDELVIIVSKNFLIFMKISLILSECRDCLLYTSRCV